MGAVYRARDTRLDRTVAIKLLSPHVAADPSLRDRLQHEARVISRLNHPHICTLYDVGDAEIAPGEAVSFLVLELIEGKTIAELLEAGRLPTDRALAYGIQIVDAIAAAHRAGIVHGDLKPANVMVSAGGVKLLDFGVSRIASPAEGLGPADATADTQTLAQQPMLGTLHYVSPEQLEGHDADVRTDIHACGTLIYEMVTGRKAFDGNSPAAVIAAILRHTPAPVTTLVPGAPVALDHAVDVCLAKDPADRWQHAGDLGRELRWISSSPAPAVGTPPRPRSAAMQTAVVAAALLLAGAGAYYALTSRRPVAAPVYRTSILLPDGLRFPVPGPLGGVGRLAISPDGERVVFVATDAAGTQQLWLRPLPALTATAMPGTEGASSPFWSPDSRRIAFVAQGQLKTTDQAGSAPTVIAAPAFNTTGAWAADNVIYFTPTSSSPLYRVDAAGGMPRPLTTLDASAGEILHRNPVPLPGGRRLLYTSVIQRPGEATRPRGIFVASVDGSDAPRELIPGATTVRVAQGHVIFLRDNALLAQPLDSSRVELSGEARTIAERVESTSPGSASLSVSETGVLAYVAASSQGSRLVWVDRSGRETPIPADAGEYGDLELAPDGQRVAVSILDRATNTRDVWLVDLARGVRTRLTVDRAEDVTPIWSPDGTRVIFASNRRGHFDLFQKPASGVVMEEMLLGDDAEKYAMTWSADGKVLYWQYDDERTSLANLSLEGEQAPQEFLGGRVSQGRLSPDGKWVVYDSAESGRSEVYVVPFPNATMRWQVSPAGGSLSRWRADGREIFYAARDNKLMAATVDSRAGELSIGIPRPLFDARPVGPRMFYAPSRDGERFLLNVLRGDTAPSITLLQNWSRAAAP